MASEPRTDTTDERTTETAPALPDLTPTDPPQASGGTPAGEGRPAKKAARKRATGSRGKKAAAVVEMPAEDDSGESGEDAPEPAPVPAKRSRTRRAKPPSAAPAGDLAAEVTSAKTSPEAGSEDPADEDATVGEPSETQPDETPEEQTPQDETPVEQTPDGEEPQEDGAGPVGQVPSFGLLFKAPEPVAPRRRRATAAAGAPSPASGPDADAGRGADVRGDDAPGAGQRGDDQRSDEVSTDGASREEPQVDEQSTTDRPEGGPVASDEHDGGGGRRSRRRGGRGRRPRGGESEQGGQDGSADEGSTEQPSTDEAPKHRGRGRRPAGSDADNGEAASTDSDSGADDSGDSDDETGDGSSRRRRRRRRGGSDGESDERQGARARDEVTGLKGSTRLEAKKQRRREGREAGRRRTIITEAEFLARRESVERVMVVREREGKTQIGVLEDGVLVEHYVSRESGASMIGNVYLGRVQNVLPSMEAAFVDIGKGRNAVLYAGEVNWDAAGLEGNVPKRIENALGSGDTVLAQVTKDPIGHKGARLTSQISLPGRFLVYVPEASMTGISRKLPDTERARLKSILKKIVPDDAGVIVRTASEGASEEELTADIARLTKTWEKIQSKVESAAKKKGSAGAPLLLHGEPDLTVKVIRDVFNEDFTSLVVSGERAWADVSAYLEDVAPELAKRLTKWTSETDLFTQYRVDEQIAKALDRKVWLPSGGSLVIDRTEAMTVVDVNTGKYVGSGGNLEETVTKNNIEAAEEIVRQLRLRDIGGIIVVDFIDMVLESNRDLVVRRLLECLGRDRTKHQVAEVTSLGLVQMTRKRVGSGLLEVFSEPCSHCAGRGVIVHSDPMDDSAPEDTGNNRGRGRGRGNGGGPPSGNQSGLSRGRNANGNDQGAGNGESERRTPTGPTAAQIAAAAHAAALKANASTSEVVETVVDAVVQAVVEADPQEGVAAAAEAPGEQSAGLTPEPTPQPGLQLPSAVTAQSATQSDAEVPTHPEVEGDPLREASTPDRREPEPEAPVERPRRKRGRVVAPAGPPGQSQAMVITTGQS